MSENDDHSEFKIPDDIAHIVCVVAMYLTIRVNAANPFGGLCKTPCEYWFQVRGLILYVDNQTLCHKKIFDENC